MLDYSFVSFKSLIFNVENKYNVKNHYSFIVLQDPGFNVKTNVTFFIC